MRSSVASCGACLRIARRRGIAIGSRLKLRNGHVGTVAAVNHFDGVKVLIHSSDEQEVLLLTLAAAGGRDARAGTA